MQHWVDKFRVAFRGVVIGIQGHSSFSVHIVMAIGVVVLAALLACSAWQWCVLLLCISLVFFAELANSAMENLARGLCQNQNERVRDALDIASGAVLMASFFSAAIGLLIFVSRLVQIFFR